MIFFVETTESTSSSNSSNIISEQTHVKVETKKERFLRLAKEKMYASWKLQNQKEEKIFETVQICKYMSPNRICIHTTRAHIDSC